MSLVRRAVAGCALGTVVLLAAACTAPHLGASGAGTGSTSTAASQDALQRTRQAVTTASSVHVTGSLLSDGQPTQIDVQLAGGQGGQGTITTGGQTLEILRLGANVYLKGDAALYAQASAASATVSPPPSPVGPPPTPTGPPPAASGPPPPAATTGPAPPATPDPTDPQKYVLVPQSNPLYGLVVRITTASTLLDDALPVGGALTEGGQKSVGGRTALAITDGAGEVDVAASGPPYPLEVRLPQSSTTGGVVTFADFGAPVTLPTPAPTDVIDLGRLDQQAAAATP